MYFLTHMHNRFDRKFFLDVFMSLSNLTFVTSNNFPRKTTFLSLFSIKDAMKRNFTAFFVNF